MEKLPASTYALRLPDELRDRVKSLAKLDHSNEAVVARRAMRLGLGVLEKEAARVAEAVR